MHWELSTYSKNGGESGHDDVGLRNHNNDDDKWEFRASGP